MTDENMSQDDKIRAAAERLGIPLPSDSDLDKIKVYHMEQEESANELYESAVSDGLPFATEADGEVYVNTKWLGMIIRTVAEAGYVSGNLPEQTQRLAEVLGQTIVAADKFVGKR